MLEQCVDLLEQQHLDSLATVLRDICMGAPVQTPADHKHHTATEMFKVQLSQEERSQVLHAIVRAKQQGLTTQQTQSRGLGGFEEAWAEYVNYG